MLLILGLQICNMIYFGHQKMGYHEDEYYSYFSSNRSDGLYTTDRTWQDRDTILREFSVEEGAGFHYGLVAQVQSWDVHPPLFYDLLHTACSLTPGVFSKWQGISVNILGFVLCFFVMSALLRRLGADPWMRLFVLAIYGFHPMTVSFVMFIRMYTWLTLFVDLCAYLHVRMLQEREQMESPGGWKYFICCILPIMVCSYLGFLTQYYYLIFFFFIGLFYTGYILLTQGHHYGLWKKAWKEAGIYVLSCIISLGLAVATYPSAAVHILRGYRGKEAISEFASAENLVGRLGFFLGLLNNDLFFGMFYVLLLLMIIALIALKIRLRTEYKMLIFAVTGYFLVVAKTALLLGRTSNRYEMPVYGLILVLLALQLRSVVMKGQKFKVPASIILIMVAFFLVGSGLYQKHMVLFLYPEDAQRISNAKAANAGDTAVIVLYNESTPDNVWRLTNEILCYDQVFYMAEDNREELTDSKITNATNLLIYAADNDLPAEEDSSRDRKTESLEIILDANKQMNGLEEIYRDEMWTLYRAVPTAQEDS